MDQPTATTILAAAKLSGKTSSGLSIGVLNAVTARERATIRFEDQPTAHETVEPLTNYFMTRLQQDFRQGKTTVGGILTATNRRIEDEQLNFLPTGAYAGGIDLRHLFSDDTYDVQVTIAATNVLGSREAITGRQEGSIHYFQRTDARHLSVDTLASGLAGYMHKVVLSKVRGEQWRGAVGELTYSPGFDANDLGFHRSVDRRTQFIWVQRREDQPGDLIRSWNLNFNAWSGFTFAGPEELTELGGNINGNLTLLNYWSLGGGLNTNLPVLHLTALWGGPAMRTDFARNIWLFVGSDQRKDWSFSVSGYRGGQPDARMEWYGIDPSLTWRPTDYFTLTTSAELNVFNDSWATWADFGPTVDMRTGEERFIMAALDQTTVSTTLRFDLTVSPTLSIQFYGSPFVTAGKFSEEKLVLEDNTRAKDFDDRFHIFTPEETDYDGQPNTFDIDGDGQTDFELPTERDFNYRQFNSNLVVRWEYQTGSAIYLVWSRNMSQGLANGDFSYGRDMGQLFGADAENVFMLKGSYLFNL